jgi:hypothetical protein
MDLPNLPSATQRRRGLRLDVDWTPHGTPGMQRTGMHAQDVQSLRQGLQTLHALPSRTHVSSCLPPCSMLNYLSIVLFKWLNGHNR